MFGPIDKAKTAGWAMLAVGLIIFALRWALAPVPAPEGDPCREGLRAAHTAGFEQGVLAVVNYDLQAAGEKPFKSWKEFNDYSNESKAREASMNQFFAEIDKARAERQQRVDGHPDWVKALKGEK